MPKNFFFKNHLIVLMAAGLLVLSCSEDITLDGGSSAEVAQSAVETPVTRNPILPDETYLTDPAKILSVLTSNVYFVYFREGSTGTQQVAAIQFKELPGNAFTMTWKDINGQYVGVGDIGNTGKFQAFVNFGNGRAIKFNLIRVVDTYGDPTHPYDVFFDKSQVINGGGINYMIDNQKYFDQVDLDSRDKDFVTPKLLANTLWAQVDFGVPPSNLEFRNNQNGFVFELSSQAGPVSGTYTQDGFVSYGSFNDDSSQMFNLQIQQGGTRQLFVVEKRDGIVKPIKKYNLTSIIVM
jgi:hypothetical protein